MRTIMIIAAAGAVSTPAWALPVAFEVEAEVAQVNDSANVLGGSVYVGQPLLMSYTFDTDATDLGDGLTLGYYLYNAGDYGARVLVGPHDWRSDPSNLDFAIQIGDNYSNLDFYTFVSFNNIDHSGLAGPITNISWQLDDVSQTAISSVALPTVHPDLSLFDPFSVLQVDGTAPDPSFTFSVFSYATAVRALPRIVANLVPPNDVRFQGTGFTPGGRLVALTAASTGGGVVPGGACAGTNTGLNAPQMRSAFVANPDGTFSVSGRLGAMSGQQLVVFDVATCTPSPPITLP